MFSSSVACLNAPQKVLLSKVRSLCRFVGRVTHLTKHGSLEPVVEQTDRQDS